MASAMVIVAQKDTKLSSMTSQVMKEICREVEDGI